MVSERYCDYASADESDEDATSVDVSDSVSVTIDQDQDSDFATIEKRNSEFFFGSFSQDSEFEMKKQESVFEDEELFSYREESFSEEDEEFHPSLHQESPFQEFMEEDCVSEIKKKSTSNFPYFLSQQDSFLESRIMESQYDIVFGRKIRFHQSQLVVDVSYNGSTIKIEEITVSRTTAPIFLTLNL
ncbi:hypothetical protein A2U01_0035674, partial [Trifolium medium]|nr:hypothetical protein [Trifolium medium]